MTPEEEQQLLHHKTGQSAGNEASDQTRNQIVDSRKSEGKSPPNKHHLVGAEGSPQKVSTSASTDSKECVEAEVLETGSNMHDQSTDNDIGHVKCPTTPVEESQSSTLTSWKKLSNNLTRLSTCFSGCLDKLKKSRDALFNANSRRAVLVSRIVTTFPSLLKYSFIIIKLYHHIPSELYDLCYDPSLILVMTVVVACLVVILMNTKQLHYLKTILRIVGKILRKLDWAIALLLLLL